jgi:hypothetical protein
MQHTPPNSKTKRVSAILLSRVILLTFLATLAPPGVNAYECLTGSSDYNAAYLGLETNGAGCAAGSWNGGCGLGCTDAVAGKYHTH